MEKNKSGYDILYSFNYKNHGEEYYYDIPYETFMEGVVQYFEDKMISIDGTDNDIYNALSELDCLDKIADEMEQWFYDRCKEEAYEEFKEYVDYYYEDEEDEEEE